MILPLSTRGLWSLDLGASGDVIFHIPSGLMCVILSPCKKKKANW